MVPLLLQNVVQQWWDMLGFKTDICDNWGKFNIENCGESLTVLGVDVAQQQWEIERVLY